MFRSSYVIGLGGTGQWILTYLKKELLEINQGTSPSNVKLLAIDTQIADVSVAAANAALVNDDRKNAITDARLGDVRLDKQTEFVQIGRPLFNFIQQIHTDRQLPPGQQQYRYLDWVDTEVLLKLGHAACDTTWGAGAFRQLGRLSLINCVDNVFNKIKVDLDTLKKEVSGGDETQQLEIHIASSSAGGTGAGTLVDIAWLVRAAARRLGFSNYVLRAFIVMPTAFDLTGVNTAQQLRTYAAWSELDRFMISQIVVKGNTKIVFNPNTVPPIEIDCNVPVFDTTYIIDPNRNDNPIAPPPDHGTFPVVAQAISFILDAQSGKNYAAHVPNVQVGGALQLPPGVYHSSLGTYTIKVPVYRARAKFSRELAFAAYEKLVQPLLSDSNIGVALRSDKNRENPRNASDEISQFLNSAAQLNQSGQDVSNTALFPHIEDVYQRSKVGQGEVAKYVLNEANNICDRRGSTFLAFVDRVPRESNTDELPAQIDELRRLNVWQKEKTRPSRDQGKTPAQTYPEIIAGVKSYDVDWFGQMSIQKINDQAVTVRTTDGIRTKTLRLIKERQIGAYKLNLITWAARMLNGINADPILAKEGKLGYVEEAFGQLMLRLKNYQSYLTLLRQRISDNKTLVARIKNHESAMASYNALKGKQCLLCFFDQNVHPRAREAEREYLRKAQKLFDFYLAEQLIKVDEETVQALLTFTQEGLAEIERWKEVLVVGRRSGDKDDVYTGLYNFMRERILENRNDLAAEMRQGNIEFQRNRSLKGVLQIIQPQLAQNTYQNNQRWLENNTPAIPYQDDQNIRDVLEKIVWKVDLNAAGNLNIACGLRGDEDPNQIVWLDRAPSAEKVSSNYFLWLNKSQRPFVTLADDHPVDQELPKDFPIADNLANDIVNWCKPMYQRRAVPAGAYDKVVFVRVDDTRNRDYLNGFRDRLRQIAAGEGGWVLNPNVPANQSNSRDPFKLTVVHAEHLMPTSDFEIWGTVRKLFMQTKTNPAAANPLVNFIYAAEKNAMELASMKPTLLTKNFEPFDPEIVSLLEEHEKTLMFFLAYALGILERSKGGGGDYSWNCGSVHLYEASGNLTGGRPPSFFDVVRLWIVGRDCRSNRSQFTIDFSDVREKIIAKENKSRQATIKAYELAKVSMGRLIEEDKEKQFGLMTDNEKRYFQSRRYTDLKDLAEIFYLQGIERIKGK